MEINKKENLKPLSDGELEQISGGDAPSPAMPVNAPPICYYKEGKKSSYFAPARCTPFTNCPYFDECANPKKPNGKPHKII